MHGRTALPENIETAGAREAERGALLTCHCDLTRVLAELG